MHLPEHRTRNCQQAKDELVPEIFSLNQHFEVARPIRKKNVMIEQRTRETSEWLSSGADHCCDFSCAFAPQMLECKWHRGVPGRWRHVYSGRRKALLNLTQPFKYIQRSSVWFVGAYLCQKYCIWS